MAKETLIINVGKNNNDIIINNKRILKDIYNVPYYLVKDTYGCIYLFLTSWNKLHAIKIIDILW